MTRHLSFGQAIVIAEAVFGIDAYVLADLPRVGLLDSAVQAQSAGFGGVDLHSRLVDTAAALAWRIAGNHALPDANKRTAWTALRVFLALNGVEWRPSRRSDDDAQEMIVAVAAGAWDRDRLAAWLEERVEAPPV